jgi:hypothetical protein
MPDQIETPQPSASAIGEQFLANGGQPVPSQPDASQNVQPAATPPQAVLAPSPEQAAAVAQTAKHTLVGRMFHALTQGGSGSSASNLWRSVISGALIGMGAAENAPVVAHGPYGDVRDSSVVGAAGRAFTAVQQNTEHQQDRQRQQAKEAQQQKQRDQEMKIQMDDLTLRKAAAARAQIASIQNSAQHEKLLQRLDLDIQNGQFDLAQRGAQAAQQQVSFFNALQDVGATPLEGADGQPLQFAGLADAEKAAHDNPTFFVGNFKTRTAYNPTVNKYEIYRVPDTDVRDVQLKDPTTGVMHTIPRMSATEYLDYQSRVQNLKKGALEITKVGEEITRMRNDFKASSQYGEALKALTAATDKDGNVDLEKIPAGNRAVLVEHASKGLEDAIRARNGALAQYEKAKEFGDQSAIDEANQNIAEATQIAKHYGGVLTTLTGRTTTSPTAQAPGSAPDTTAPGVGQFQAEQKAKVDAAKKAQADQEKNFNERPAEPKTQVVTVGRNAQHQPNPAYNEAEQYISEHPTLTGPQRADIRAAHQQKNAPQQYVAGGTVYNIPPDQVSAFLAAHPEAKKQ